MTESVRPGDSSDEKRSLADSSAPPVALTSDSDDLLRRKYEELYALARLAYDYEWKRIEAAENKATQFVALMAVIFGLNAAGFQEFIPALGHAFTPAGVTFIVSFVLLSMANAWALWHFLWALAVAKVMRIPADDGLVAHVRTNRYIDVIYTITLSFLGATQLTRKHTDRKFRFLRGGFWGLAVAIFLGMTCVASFVAMHSGGAKS